MKKVFLMLVVFFGLVSLQAFADADGPVGMLQSVADQMIDGLKSNKVTLKSNPRFVYSLADKIVVPHADLNEMSMRVLPPQTWKSATPAQRAQFQKEFTTVLIRTYASALAEYRDETVRFFPVRGGYQGKTAVKVDSEITRTDGPSIAVSYRVVLKGSEWKLYDMMVEGVSLLESFRSQFADSLSRGDMANLIAELSKHNAENHVNE